MTGHRGSSRSSLLSESQGATSLSCYPLPRSDFFERFPFRPLPR